MTAVNTIQKRLYAYNNNLLWTVSMGIEQTHQNIFLLFGGQNYIGCWKLKERIVSIEWILMIFGGHKPERTMTFGDIDPFYTCL